MTTDKNPSVGATPIDRWRTTFAGIDLKSARVSEGERKGWHEFIKCWQGIIDRLCEVVVGVQKILNQLLLIGFVVRQVQNSFPVLEDVADPVVEFLVLGCSVRRMNKHRTVAGVAAPD